jgi:hypothetical protein
MNTIMPTEIKVLDNLLALNLNISLWSARKKLNTEDFGGVELPPEDLATLGSKRIAPPEKLRIFSTLKARAFNYLDRHGVRFLGGWAIPEEKAGDIIAELSIIRDEFNTQKETFLNGYNECIQDWIDQHASWGNIIADSTVDPDYVRARMGFVWQMYKVAPLMQHADEQAVLNAGLSEEVENLGNTLFGEVAKTADDIWTNVYEGKTEVTHKALSPLKTLQAKLKGLSFIEPHIAPLTEIIQMAFNRMPKKGNIMGTDLLVLQGLVCMLKHPEEMLRHSQKLIEGYGPATVLDAFLHTSKTEIILPDMPQGMPVAQLPTAIPSMGLW